jgi:hypothetical protein
MLVDLLGILWNKCTILDNSAVLKYEVYVYEA